MGGCGYPPINNVKPIKLKIMTDKQIEVAKRTLPNWTEIPYKEWTAEQKNLDNELSCREMINSCLIYGQMNDFYRESTGEWGR